jgi:hypothetical protein
VREHVQVFIDTASRVLLLTVKLTGSGDPLDDKDREQLASSASAEFAAAGAVQKAIITALHLEDGNGAHSPARVRRPRAVVNGGNTAGRENGSRTSRRRPARGLEAGDRHVT